MQGTAAQAAREFLLTIRMSYFTHLQKKSDHAWVQNCATQLHWETAISASKAAGQNFIGVKYRKPLNEPLKAKRPALAFCINMRTFSLLRPNERERLGGFNLLAQAKHTAIIWSTKGRT